MCLLDGTYSGGVGPMRRYTLVGSLELLLEDSLHHFAQAISWQRALADV
jgi:hypothetical protein